MDSVNVDINRLLEMMNNKQNREKEKTMQRMKTSCEFIFEMYQCFIEVGFNDTQAFNLIITMINKCII